MLLTGKKVSEISDATATALKNKLGVNDEYDVVLTVKPSGGDYTNPYNAVKSITDSSINKKYKVEVYPGTYDIFEAAKLELPTIVWHWSVLALPDYVDLIGMGSPENTLLFGKIPSDVTVSEQQRTWLSTLNLRFNNRIENLNITSEGVIYAVHLDAGQTVQNSRIYITNCKFSTDNIASWGEGSASGQYVEFNNCDFRTIYLHNTAGSALPSKHIFKNCRIYGNGIIVQSIGSGVQDIVEFNNCSIVRLSITGDTVHEHIIYGGGNSFPHIYEITQIEGQKCYYNFSEESLIVENGDDAIISKGTPVEWSNIGLVLPTINPLICCGIAWEDIAVGGKGVIKNAGYLTQEDAGLSGLAAGDLIGITDGALAKVTTGDIIGIVTYTGMIKLKLNS